MNNFTNQVRGLLFFYVLSVLLTGSVPSSVEKGNGVTSW